MKFNFVISDNFCIFVEKGIKWIKNRLEKYTARLSMKMRI